MRQWALKGAARTLKQMMGHQDVQQHLHGLRVGWTFNVDLVGGIFERQVRSTKIILRKMVDHSTELLTLLSKIEMVINSRPYCSR